MWATNEKFRQEYGGNDEEVKNKIMSSIGYKKDILSHRLAEGGRIWRFILTPEQKKTLREEFIMWKTKQSNG